MKKIKLTSIIISVITSTVILSMFGCEKSANNNEITSSGASVEHVQTLADSNVLNDNEKQASSIQEVLPASVFMTAQWVDLIPKDDLDVLLNPPSYIDNIAENSAEDLLINSFTNAVSDNALAEITLATNTPVLSAEEERYQQALVSTRVISAINNVAIRMPAFIVPLEFDDEQRVTQFFMVPFFGACIHEPPPPPNQTIFVNYPKGFILPSLTEPYWISGILKTSLVENELAVAAYTIEMHHYELYTDE